MIEKIGDIEIKVNLQPLFYIKEINSKYPKNYYALAKKDKNDIYQESCNKTFNKDKNKAKSQNSSTNQSQTQVLKITNMIIRETI